MAPSAGASRDTNADTKLYQVPRELIEIARAHANGSESAGKTTPLAPRPDAELQATLRAYTERLSSKAPPLPSVALDAQSAAHGASADATPVDAVASGVRATCAVAFRPEAADARRGAARSPRPIEPGQGRAAKPEPRSLRDRRPSAHGAAPRMAPAASTGGSRAWIGYAVLALLGLASCAHVLFGG